jgi:hypothetical protein
MKIEIISKLQKNFEECINDTGGLEFWFARDLQKLPDYNGWRNFVNVKEKAKISCEKSVHLIADHFVDVNKKIPLPKTINLKPPPSSHNNSAHINYIFLSPRRLLFFNTN